MNHYPAFLRPYHGKSSNTTNNSSSSNNETDENSSIKNLFFKHLSKAQQTSVNTNNITTKNTMRGILGEVGNMSLSNKPMASIITTKSKTVQQQSVATTVLETKAMITIPAPPPAVLPTLITPMVVNKIEEMNLHDDKENDECMPHEPITKLTEVPSEFDCDSGDLYNITTVSEYVVDICKYWRELEQNVSIRQNFLLNRNEGKQNKCIYSIMSFIFLFL
jgi:hypothetical protein